MSRSYQIDVSKLAAQRGGGYLVAQPKDRPDACRPNRTAAGLSVTQYRGETRFGKTPTTTAQGDRLALLTRGTLDTLARQTFRTKQGVCPCCGGRDPNRVQLADTFAHSRRPRAVMTSRARNGFARLVRAELELG